jgi:hypothetical protein
MVCHAVRDYFFERFYALLFVVVFSRNCFPFSFDLTSKFKIWRFLWTNFNMQFNTLSLGCHRKWKLFSLILSLTKLLQDHIPKKMNNIALSTRIVILKCFITGFLSIANIIRLLIFLLVSKCIETNLENNEETNETDDSIFEGNDDDETVFTFQIKWFLFIKLATL